MNSRNGSITASASVLGGGAAASAPSTNQGHRHADEHEPGREPVDGCATEGGRRGSARAPPGRASRSGRHRRGSRCRARSSSSGSTSRRYASSTMSWLALKNATARGEVRDRAQIALGSEAPERRRSTTSRQLRHQHPAAPPAEQRRARSGPSAATTGTSTCRQLDQREEADRLQIRAVRAQPRRQRLMSR